MMSSLMSILSKSLGKAFITGSASGTEIGSPLLMS